jgi:hypothetical protein
MSGEAELEFARIWRPIPKVVSSRTLNSVAGNARLATDDIATEVGRLRYQPYTPGATMTLISPLALPDSVGVSPFWDRYRR